MNLTKFFSVVLVFLHCNVGIGCLEIKLDGFRLQCHNDGNCYASAAEIYYLTGTVVLKVGEKLPKFIRYEEMCLPSNSCLTRDGTGSYDRYYSKPTTYCQNSTVVHLGCYLLSERTYRFSIYIGFYYFTRFCKYRVRPCDDAIEACAGPASNELKVSDLRTWKDEQTIVGEQIFKEKLRIGPLHNILCKQIHPIITQTMHSQWREVFDDLSIYGEQSVSTAEERYRYDTFEDGILDNGERKCWWRTNKGTAHNGNGEKRHPSADFLMILGVVLGIIMIAFY